MFRLLLWMTWAAVLVLVPVAPGGTADVLGSREVAFNVSLDGHVVPCVAQSSSVRAARRLSGTIGYAVSAWSPDGSRVALDGGTGATNPIRVEDADGTGLHAVSGPRLATEDDSGAAWSPEGTALAFSRYVFYGKHTDYNRFGVWIVDVRTRRERQLTREYARAVAWSPTGDVIAADLGEDGDAKITFFRPDGAVVRTLTVPGFKGFNAGLSWSPDGTRLAVGGGAVIDREGAIVGRYASPSTDEQVSASPDWSPDGRTIAFARFATRIDPRVNVRYALQSDLYEAPADGGEAVRLTRTPNLSEGGPRFRIRGGSTLAGTGQKCVIEATVGRDVIRGSPRGDLVDAGPGNDVVYGRGGADVIAGGIGNDVLWGGDGRDELRGGPGNDTIHARDRARDAVSGGPGRDRAWVDPKLDLVANVEMLR
jgi:hypothetical protein